MPTEPPSEAASRLANWNPLRVLTDLARVTADTWRIAGENHDTLTRLEQLMADVSTVLNQVADGLRGPLLTSIQELIASEQNARQEAANAVQAAAEARGEADALRAEDVGESDAARNVRTAFNEVAANLNGVPEVPDVEPLPEPTPEG